MKTDNLDVILSYPEIGGGKLYKFYIDEDFELKTNEKLIKRNTYDRFETYEDAFNAYQNIRNGNINKIVPNYVLIL